MELRELTAIHGVSGDEGRIREYILNHARPLADDTRVDKLGNVFAFKRGTAENRRHVLLCAHMDEVGLILQGIDDNGLIRYLPVGGIDPRVVISKRVEIGPDRINGVIGAKAIHLQSAADRKAVLGHDKLAIDIGAKDKPEAAKHVKPGEYAAFHGRYQEYGDGFVASKALDDRVGCYALLKILEGSYPVDITCAFTVQEEVGTKGATVAGRQVAADAALVLETTSANDLGDIDHHRQVCAAGRGVAISFMDMASMADPALYAQLLHIAQEQNIPHQIKSAISGGNDAGALQRAQSGLKTCVLSVPCRFIHAPTSTCALRDIEAQIALTRAYLNA